MARQHNIGPTPRMNALVRRARRKDDPLEGQIEEVWSEYLDDFVATSNLKPTRLHDVKREAQGASIAATDITEGELAAGCYAVHYYQRISRAATTSSSLSIAFDWTDGGVPISQSFAAITGNTTATQQNDGLFIRVDKGTPVRYATTYASLGATSMLYKLDISLTYVKS